MKLTEYGLEDAKAQRAIWPAIIEKAVAKMLGGYLHTVGGIAPYGVNLLTGSPSW